MKHFIIWKQELHVAAPFGIKTPADETTLFDDIITEWTNQRAENGELQNKVDEEREKMVRLQEAVKVKKLLITVMIIQ